MPGDDEKEVLSPRIPAADDESLPVADDVVAEAERQRIADLREVAEAATRELNEAIVAADPAAAPEEPRERQPAHAEHESRVDENSEERATHQEREPLAPWIRPSSLEAPPPRDGLTQRWIRISTKGVDDPRNVNKSMREGWVPRPMDSMPATFVMSSGSPGEEQGGHFIVDDLMLCEMPTKIYAQRRAYYESLTVQQMEAVEQELEASEVEGHRIKRTHRSSVSHPARVVGRQVQAQADD